MKRTWTIMALCAAMLCAACTKQASDPSSASASSSGSADDFAGSSAGASSSSLAAPVLSKQEEDSLFAFSWSLFGHTHQAQSNTLVSPLSVLFALGMAANGAKGQTLAQMEQTLGADLDGLNAFSARSLSLAKTNGQLSLANSLWSDGIDLKPAYREVLSGDYDAFIQSTDFSGQAVDEINAWVSSATNGQIDHLVSPEDLENAALLLIDALSFEAVWEEPYEGNQISKFSFTDAKGNTAKNLVSLSNTEKEYIDAGELHGWIKPYEQGDYVFAALLPKDDARTLDDCLAALDASTLIDALENAQSKRVLTTLPSFVMEESIELNGALKTMGIQDAFDGQADFSGMSDRASLSISKVLQKTKIRLDEKGTQAAAATGVLMYESAAIEPEAEIEIVCDRPFLYLILDRQSGMPILMGTLEEDFKQPARS